MVPIVKDKKIIDFTNELCSNAPVPGGGGASALMGAIGAAMYAKECSKNKDFKHSFIDYDSLKNFTYSQDNKSICPYCTNHCNRTILKFSTGETFVGNNRCEKGEIVDNPNTDEARNKLKEINKKDLVSIKICCNFALP